MSTSRVRAIGIAWFRRQDYAKARKLFEDGHKLPATFDKWLKLAQKAAKDFERQGCIVKKAYIDPDTFADWCRTRGLNIDSSARQIFAELAVKEYRKNH